MDKSFGFTSFFHPHLQHIATQTHTHTKRFQAALLVSKSWQILFTSSYRELLFHVSLVVNRSGCQICHNVLGRDNEQYQIWWKATAWLKRNIFDIAFPAASKNITWNMTWNLDAKEMCTLKTWKIDISEVLHYPPNNNTQNAVALMGAQMLGLLTAWSDFIGVFLYLHRESVPPKPSLLKVWWWVAHLFHIQEAIATDVIPLPSVRQRTVPAQEMTSDKKIFWQHPALLAL